MDWIAIRQDSGERNFSLLRSIQIGSRAHAASYPMRSKGRGRSRGSGSGRGRKRGVKLTTTPPYVFMAWCLKIRHRDNLAVLYLTYIKHFSNIILTRTPRFPKQSFPFRLNALCTSHISPMSVPWLVHHILLHSTTAKISGVIRTCIIHTDNKPAPIICTYEWELQSAAARVSD